MNEWQPIETAPRDGTSVLLFFPFAGRRVHLGRFIDKEDIEYGKSVRRRQYWWIGFGLSSDSDPEPTHWLPLPNDPTGASWSNG